MSIKAFLAAARDAATLKYLKGGHGEGCNSTVDNFSNLRAVFHHFTMWGFLLCFAATCAATVYDYFMGIPAPYAYSSVPVVLGSLGGIGLLIGPVGLFVLKMRSDPRPANITQLGMDYAFIVLLFLISPHRYSIARVARDIGNGAHSYRTFGLRTGSFRYLAL